MHEPAYLESLAQPEALARIFAVSPGEIVVDEVMRTVRLAVGGTIAATREALSKHGPAFNFAGGFHHAGPAVGGGFCALDDVAIAIAAVRHEGFAGQIVIVDLDAHPPDGLAACVLDDPRVHIGSISGSDWGLLPGSPQKVDENFLFGARDPQYLSAVAALLTRLPRPRLAFVLAGGDVLAGDRLGQLALSLEGVRARDRMVAEWLDGVASVWLPAGGYSEASWKVLVGTYLAVTRRSMRPVRDLDPQMIRFASISHRLDPARLSGSDDWSLAEVEEELYGRPTPAPRLLGYYTREGLEYALAQYGVLEHVQRLGYTDLRVDIEPPDEVGQRVTVRGDAGGRSHLLIDLIVSRGEVAGEPMLMLQWMSLRNPRAAFVDRKPLPGQEVPGLGLARDMGQLLGRMAERLGLRGVAFRPAFMHTAYAARTRFRFVDADRQLRFVSLLADLRDESLAEITRALAEGRVRMDGAPYAWEPDLMIYRPADPPPHLDPPEGPRPHFSIDA